MTFMEIAFVQTGGTIDKNYPATATTHGYNFEIGSPAFENILAKIKPSFPWQAYSLLKKDSLDITEEDRQHIYEGVRNIREERVILTHGTDTIYQTAEKLSAITDKFIILTGAMLPNEFVASDAMFNLGMAIGAIQSLTQKGVYIALYGKVVPWREYPKLAGGGINR